MALMEVYPSINLEDIGMKQLSQMVIELPDFADEPMMVNDGILKHILREWYEESNR